MIEARALRPKGLTWGSFRTLFTLMVLGDQHPAQIAARSGVSDAAVSGVLNTLERQGYLDRSVDTEDRRRVRVSITDAGRRLVLDAYSDQNEVEREVVSLLSSEERAVIESASRRLLLALRPDRSADGSAAETGQDHDAAASAAHRTTPDAHTGADPPSANPRT